MAHSLALLPLPTSSSSLTRNRAAAAAAAANQRESRHQQPAESQCSKGTLHFRRRREAIHGLIAAGVGSLLVPGDAYAAKRRPPAPAPAPEEKPDPNVSGVLAKVLASKKRKGAMKEAMAKLREQGKPINGKPINEPPINEPPNEPSQ